MLNVTDHWWIALLWAGGAGLLGGFVYELLQTRSAAPNSSGQIELPHGGGPSFFDLGLVASMIVGATAAIAFCYFNQPEQVTKVLNGVSTTTRSYDGIKLIAVSLIVGSAGSSFFSSMQDKLRAALSSQRIQLVDQTYRTAVLPLVHDQADANPQLRGAADAVAALSAHAVQQALPDSLVTPTRRRRAKA